MTSSQKIDPVGVNRVLASVGTEQQDLVVVLGKGELGVISAGIGEAGGLIVEAPKAPQALMENQKSNLQAVTNRAVADTNGMVNAVVSHNQGQEAMVGEFQR